MKIRMISACAAASMLIATSAFAGQQVKVGGALVLGQGDYGSTGGASAGGFGFGQIANSNSNTGVNAGGNFSGNSKGFSTNSWANANGANMSSAYGYGLAGSLSQSQAGVTGGGDLLGLTVVGGYKSH